jgi:hypothetical protein
MASAMRPKRLECREFHSQHGLQPYDRHSLAWTSGSEGFNPNHLGSGHTLRGPSFSFKSPAPKGSGCQEPDPFRPWRVPRPNETGIPDPFARKDEIANLIMQEGRKPVR